MDGSTGVEGESVKCDVNGVERSEAGQKGMWVKRVHVCLHMSNFFTAAKSKVGKQGSKAAGRCKTKRQAGLV